MDVPVTFDELRKPDMEYSVPYECVIQIAFAIFTSHIYYATLLLIPTQLDRSMIEMNRLVYYFLRTCSSLEILCGFPPREINVNFLHIKVSDPA